MSDQLLTSFADAAPTKRTGRSGKLPSHRSAVRVLIWLVDFIQNVRKRRLSEPKDRCLVALPLYVTKARIRLLKMMPEKVCVMSLREF